MSDRYDSPYQPPTVTVDVICFRVRNESLETLTAVRFADPFRGESSLPGVYMPSGETIFETAFRALRTKTGAAPDFAHFDVAGVADAVGRDPRGHALSIVVQMLTDTFDPPNATWTPVDELPAMPFGHNQLIADARERLRNATFDSVRSPIRALHGNKTPVTTTSLLPIVRAIYDPNIDTSNMRRRILQSGVAEPGGEVAAHGVGRPARTWCWVDQD